MGIGAKKRDDYNAIDCVIGENSKLKGEFHTKGSMHVSGEVEGKIQADGDIFLAETASIKGDIEGARISVSGKVVGNVHAHAGIEIAKMGQVEGDINTPRLTIEDGANYKGKVNIGTLDKAVSTSSAWASKKAPEPAEL